MVVRPESRLGLVPTPVGTIDTPAVNPKDSQPTVVRFIRQVAEVIVVFQGPVLIQDRVEGFPDYRIVLEMSTIHIEILRHDLGCLDVTYHYLIWIRIRTDVSNYLARIRDEQGAGVGGIDLDRMKEIIALLGYSPCPDLDVVEILDLEVVA